MKIASGNWTKIKWWQNIPLENCVVLSAKRKFEIETSSIMAMLFLFSLFFTNALLQYLYR